MFKPDAALTSSGLLACASIHKPTYFAGTAVPQSLCSSASNHRGPVRMLIQTFIEMSSSDVTVLAYKSESRLGQRFGVHVRLV